MTGEERAEDVDFEFAEAIYGPGTDLVPRAALDRARTAFAQLDLVPDTPRPTGSLTGCVTLDAEGHVAAYLDDLSERLQEGVRLPGHELRVALAAAPWVSLVFCDDPRLRVGGACPLDHPSGAPVRVAEHAAVLRENSTDDLEWAVNVFAWGGATQAAPFEVQGWLLIDACLRLVRRAGGPGEAWVAGVMRRYGFDGHAPVTLDVVGKAVGVTRERVRQVQDKVADRLRARPLWLPALDRIQQAMRGPVRPVSELLAGLRDGGVTVGVVDFAGLAAAAQAVGADKGFFADLPVTGMTAEVYTRVVKSLRAPLGTPGVGAIAEVTDVLAAEGVRLAAADGSEAPVTAAEVRAVADTVAEVVWADPQRRWYLSGSRSPARVRFRNIARKMLSVHPQLPVAAIVEGLHRQNTYRGEDIHVGLDQARAFFTAHPEFTVDGDLVSCVEELDYRVELGDSTRRMVEAFRTLPDDVGSRGEALEASVQAGVKENTASMWLTFNEVIVDHGWAVWGLVGSHPSPARVEAIQESVREQFENMNLTSSFDAQGRLQVRFKATKSFLKSGVISWNWPAHLRVTDGYDALVAGKPVGVARFSRTHNFSWGWGAPSTALKVKHGETIEASFDVAAGTVALAKA